MLIYLGIPLLAMIIRRGNQNMDPRIILLGALIFVDKFKLLKSKQLSSCLRKRHLPISTTDGDGFGGLVDIPFTYS